MLVAVRVPGPWQPHHSDGGALHHAWARRTSSLGVGAETRASRSGGPGPSADVTRPCRRDRRQRDWDLCRLTSQFEHRGRDRRQLVPQSLQIDQLVIPARDGHRQFHDMYDRADSWVS